MEKQRAAQLRQTVADEKKKQTYRLIKQLKVIHIIHLYEYYLTGIAYCIFLQDEWVQQKVDLQENLEYQFRENLMEMGKGHREATDQVNSFSNGHHNMSDTFFLQPDYEHQWLTKTLENENRAAERGQQALDKLHGDMMQNENERNLHLLHR